MVRRWGSETIINLQPKTGYNIRIFLLLDTPNYHNYPQSMFYLYEQNKLNAN